MANKTLGKDAALDTQIACGLIAAGLLSDDGIQQIKTVFDGASDPASAMGNLIFQVMATVAIQLENQGIKVDDKVWVAGGGVLDRVMHDIVSILTEAFGFQEAATPEFIESMRDSIIDLMEQDENAPKSDKPLGTAGMQQPMAQGSGLLSGGSAQGALNPPRVAPPQGPPPQQGVM